MKITCFFGIKDDINQDMGGKKEKKREREREREIKIDREKERERDKERERGGGGLSVNHLLEIDVGSLYLGPSFVGENVDSRRV